MPGEKIFLKRLLINHTVYCLERCACIAAVMTANRVAWSSCPVAPGSFRSAGWTAPYFCTSVDMIEVTNTSMVRNTNTVPMPSNIRLSPSDINSPEFTQHFLVFFISPALPVEISVCALYRKTGNFSIKTGASDNFSEITLTFASHLPKSYPSNKQVSAIYGKLFPISPGCILRLSSWLNFTGQTHCGEK